MLIKAYIKKHMFHLPMEDNLLLNQVQEDLNKEEVDKSSIEKTNPLTKIEDDNGNILIEKQHTNIFLLNLLLLVLNRNKKVIEKQEHYKNNVIIGKLEEEIKIDLKVLTFEEIEKKVSNYLNPTIDKPQTDTEDTEESDKNPHLENVKFSVDWLKGAQKEVEQKWITQKQKQKKN